MTRQPILTPPEIAELVAKLHPHARPRYAKDIKRLYRAHTLQVPVSALPETQRDRTRAMASQGGRPRKLGPMPNGTP